MASRKSSVSSSSSLAVYRSKSLLSWFELWVAELTSRLPELPVITMLATGLWPVLVRVSREMSDLGREPPKTELEAQHLAERVHRLFEVGLRLRYGNDYEAAAAELVNTLRSSMAAQLMQLPHDQTLPSQAVWERPVAQFIARYVKAARDYRAELVLLWERQQSLRGRTPIDSRRNFGYLEDTTKTTGEIQAVLAFLDLTEGKAPNWAGRRALTMRTILLNEERLLHALSRLPYRLDARHLPEALRLGGETWCIETTWLQTQLLLAAIDAEDVEFIMDRQFREALTAVKQQKAEAVVNRLLERFDRRGWQPADPVERELIRAQGLKLHKNMQKVKPLLDEQTLMAFLILVDPATFTLSHKVALEAATTSSGGLEPIWADLTSAQIADAINWRSVTPSDVRQMARVQTIPAVVIAEHLSQTTKPQEAARHLIASPRLDQETVRVLVRQNLFPELDLSETEVLRPSLPDSVLAATLWRILPTTKARTQLWNNVDPALLLHLLKAAPSEDLERRLLAPVLRPPVVLMLETKLFNTVSMANADLTEKDLFPFQKKLSTETWRQLILSAMLYSYRIEYDNADDTGKLNSVLPPWELAHQNKDMVTDHRLLLRLSAPTPKLLARLLQENPEETVFNWLYAGLKPEALKRAWRDYVRKRTLYFDLIEKKRSKKKK